MLYNLPSELNTLIFEMNPEHREKFDSLVDELKLTAAKKRCARIGKIYESSAPTDTYEDCLYDNISDPDVVLEGLSKCNCCSRHASKKPRSINNSGDYTGYQSINFLRDLTCQCDCRHNSRFIYHTFVVHRDEFNESD